jgi:hypothetical protein
VSWHTAVHPDAEYHLTQPRSQDHCCLRSDAQKHI